MATKKGKLDFKMVLIIVLTIGLAITIYTLTTQSLENRSSAGWKPPQPPITKTMDSDNVKACKASCDREKQYCKDAAKQEFSGEDCLNQVCEDAAKRGYDKAVKRCTDEANACKRACK